MTRINCVPVSELTREHLVAEYRELPRVLKLARLPKDNEVFPTEYTLGEEHVKFFYNKLEYISNRFTQLVAEMKRRGYSPNFEFLPDSINSVPMELWGSWVPTKEALAINRARIQQRLSKGEQNE